MANIPHFDRFWMVCRKPTGPLSETKPRTRYSSFEDALNAARKLATENEGQFYILETVATARPGEARQETLF
ncbi:hypothetical protein ACN2XU_02615 [Primorskyibacter sp. 2E107]|uniref:hypothetical protein n=1 Tax=Primorskyibacter sp. 2E107 TaxID=3403458 RepID=UPI003AF6D1BA